MDKLINEGWAFTRMYATGTRSVRGIEAVTTGFSPTPARSVVKLGKSQNNFFSIAGLLKTQQYHTQFIYGGESHFDNMKSFFLGNGFVDMQDLPTFSNPKFVGSWGASDEDLFNKADEQFTQMAKEGKPFFSLVFTSSNHSPFEYPDGVITQYNEPKQTVENAVKYADYALGQFVEKAKNLLIGITPCLLLSQTMTRVHKVPIQSLWNTFIFQRLFLVVALKRVKMTAYSASWI